MHKKGTPSQSRIKNNMGRRAALALNVLNNFVEHPISTSRALREKLGVSQPTIDRTLQNLCGEGILKETTGHARGRRYAYRAYLSIFENAT